MTLPKPSDMAALASTAYLGPWRWQLGDVKVIDGTFDGWRVIGYRGTTHDEADILRDMRFIPWWSPRVGFCPAGFFKGVRAVQDAIGIDCAEDLKAGKLILVGHSLGGSMALILGAWLTALGYPPAAVYAFEPARCGGFKMRRLWRKIPLVFVSWCGNDIVPLVPPLYLLPPVVSKIGKAQFDPLRNHRIAQVIDDLKAGGL